MIVLQHLLPSDGVHSGVDITDGDLPTGSNALQRPDFELPSFEENKGVRLARMVNGGGNKIQRRPYRLFLGWWTDSDAVGSKLIVSFIELGKPKIPSFFHRK